jgi:hypothetical protein
MARDEMLVRDTKIRSHKGRRIVERVGEAVAAPQ